MATSPASRTTLLTRNPAPRLCLAPFAPIGGLISAESRAAGGVEIALEEGIGLDVADELRRRGHRVRAPVRGAERDLFGRGQVIQVHKARAGHVLCAGSDGRGDGAAMGW